MPDPSHSPTIVDGHDVRMIQAGHGLGLVWRPMGNSHATARHLFE